MKFVFYNNLLIQTDHNMMMPSSIAVFGYAHRDVTFEQTSPNPSMYV